MACLKELSDEPDVTIERIRQRLVPLLKGNPLLLDWFLQCIGPDNVDNAKDEYETVLMRKGNDCLDDDAESFEYMPQSAFAMDPTENPCHIRYMNGRLFYGSRFPLPAKLSFSAVPCSLAAAAAAANDGERPPSINCDKSNQFRCMHSIKSFGDSKMRDFNKNHVDCELVGNDELEMSDDERPCGTPNEEKMSIDEDVEHTSPVAGTSHGSEHTLCDEALLRAHSIRLNPSVHATLMHANSELLNRLKQTHAGEM